MSPEGSVYDSPGWAERKRDLAEIREEAAHLRARPKAAGRER
jgi:hypothetical protein